MNLAILPRRPWTAQERALLCQAYVEGGIAKARAALPYRGDRGLYMEAHKLGLRSPTQKPRSIRRYETSEHIDAAIRAYYQSERMNDFGRCGAFARQLNRPDWWIRKRAAILGLAVPRLKPVEWSQAELDLLEKHGHKALANIRRILKTNGFVRTETAIGLQLKRRGIERSSMDEYSAHALAKLMGVDSKTVTRWIAVDGLPAKRRGTHRTAEQGGDAWVITRSSLRRWIASHQQLVDLRKVDRFWFLDLALGPA